MPFSSIKLWAACNYGTHYSLQLNLLSIGKHNFIILWCFNNLSHPMISFFFFALTSVSMKYVVISKHQTALITLAAFEISDSGQVVSVSCRRSVARLQSMNWALQGNSVFTRSSSTGRSRRRITDRTPQRSWSRPSIQRAARKHFSAADVCDKGPRTNVFRSFTYSENTMIELIQWL